MLTVFLGWKPPTWLRTADPGLWWLLATASCWWPRQGRRGRSPSWTARRDPAPAWPWSATCWWESLKKSRENISLKKSSKKETIQLPKLHQIEWELTRYERFHINQYTTNIYCILIKVIGTWRDWWAGKGFFAVKQIKTRPEKSWQEYNAIPKHFLFRPKLCFFLSCHKISWYCTFVSSTHNARSSRIPHQVCILSLRSG